MVAVAAPEQTQSQKLGMMKLKLLKQMNPRLDLQRTRKLHAMYRGGCSLLENAAVMNDIFPKYSHERDTTYNERKRRAFYENVFAAVINQMSAGLAQDPVRYQHIDGSLPIDSYWTDLLKNAVSLNLPVRSFDQVLRDLCVEALVCEYAWIQADLPKTDEYPSTLGEQEESGGLRAYLCQWSTEHVLDWEYDDDGILLWVKVYRGSRKAMRPDQPRDTVVHCWTIWDAQGWTRYEVKESPREQPPNDEADVAPVESGTHSFGCVPWVMLDVGGRQGKPSLHIGDMLESLCRAHFNLWNGEMFTLTQCNFQQLYEFLAPEIGGVDTPISDAQTDPNRANREARAPGAVHVRGGQDRAEFVAPEMAGAAAAKQAVDDLRDAIYRVTQQMALSQDTSGAMLKRSADSKKQDAVAQEIVLGAIGKLLLSVAREIVKLLARGRGDTLEEVKDEFGNILQQPPPELIGYESFDVDDVDDIIEQSVTIEQIQIPSRTYQVEQKYRLAIAHLGDATDESIRLKIRTELEQAITQDQLMAPAAGMEDDEEDDDQDGEDGDQPEPTTPVATDEQGKVAVADGSQPNPTTSSLPEEITKHLSEDYSPDALSWIPQARWSGPQRVDLSEIDYSNSQNWYAAEEPDKISAFAGRIEAGWEKPILLVKRPGADKLMIVDGHHRALAYLHHQKSALAYIGEVDELNGPWDTMHQEQKGPGSSGAKTASRSGSKPDQAPNPEGEPDEEEEES